MALRSRTAFLATPGLSFFHGKASQVTVSWCSRSQMKCCTPRKIVSIQFQPEGVSVDATPGEPIGAVAYRGGVEIAQDCGVGECGTCEVYLIYRGECSVVRSCIEPVPEEDAIVDSLGLEVP